MSKILICKNDLRPDEEKILFSFLASRHIKYVICEWNEIENWISKPDEKFILITSPSNLEKLNKADLWVDLKRNNVSTFVAWNELTRNEDFPMIIEELSTGKNKWFKGHLDFTKPAKFWFISILNEYDQQMGDDRIEELLNDHHKLLDSIIETSLTELERSKSIHSRMFPIREDKKGNYHIHSRYMAGLSPGGDFYDCIAIDGGKILLIMTTTNSYAISGMLLSKLEMQRNNKVPTFENMVNEYLALGRDIFSSKLGKSTPEVNLFFAVVDKNAQKLEYYSFGDFVISSVDNSFMGKKLTPIPENKHAAHGEIDFGPGSQLVILSSGIIKETDGYISDVSLNAFCEKNISMGPKEFLNELFFNLKSASESNYLNYDCTGIYLEVDNHVLKRI